MINIDTDYFQKYLSAQNREKITTDLFLNISKSRYLDACQKPLNFVIQQSFFILKYVPPGKWT
ncbi:hypothetical protein AD936_08460 [Gluconobacter japonicus]|nr:hypothetical protein AD936_08460 [Gluconobacter japonicus]